MSVPQEAIRLEPYVNPLYRQPERMILPNCPPGLEYLTTVSSLFVQQKIEMLELITGFETENKYTIKNQSGEKIYYAKEQSECCERQCCGPLRSFDLKIMDAGKNEIIHLNRPLACDSCCFPCCLQTMEVSAPPGNLIGTIEQQWSFWTPKFVIKDAVGNIVLRIKGPCCTFGLCTDVNFKVLSKDGEVQVGKISKKWSGTAREYFTDADFFGVSFPMSLDVKMKAVMLGAVFLIDMMYFESNDGGLLGMLV